MKNKFLFIGGFLALSVFSGCEKEFLERPPEDTLVDANFFQTNEQVYAASAPLYSVVWKDYVDKAYWALGDIRAGTLFRAWGNRDHVLFNTTEVSSENAEAYRAFYIVIGQSNTLIQNVNRYAGADVSQEVIDHVIAEARFMRATAYTFLVMNYGPVPIIEDNYPLLNNSDVTPNTVESVWEFITRDYQFAAENLPAAPVAPGRVTRWSAEGMLARTYLNRAGVGGALNQEYLRLAQQYAQSVISSGAYSLLSDYADLFRYPYDNNAESLFEQQWVFTTNYGYANTMVSQLTYSNDIANGDGWGGDLGASWWMLDQYEGLMENGFTNDRRLKPTFMLPGFHYPEITQTIGTDEDGNPIQQELVFPVPATDATGSFANVKKYVVGKAQDVGGQATTQRYPNNTYMLRLAEMYLIYAEATLLLNGGSTTDDTALEYFNTIRSRAGVAQHEGPLTWDDVFSERVKEFAVEGLAWYDLVRLHYYNPQHAYDIINSQDRGLFVIQPNRTTNPTAWTFVKDEGFEERTANATSGNFQLPIPAAEASQAPSLRNEPVPYDFGG